MIREQRERRGLSQQALGDLAGINKEAVSMLETGKTWPQYPTLQAIAAALGVPETTLFAGAPAPSPTPQEALAVLEREIGAARARPESDPLASRVARIKDPAARRAIEAMLPAWEKSVPADEKSREQDGKVPDRDK